VLSSVSAGVAASAIFELIKLTFAKKQVTKTIEIHEHKHPDGSLFRVIRTIEEDE
jgi:hypothetical protein